MISVLVLGGTGEARELAGLLAAHPQFEAVSSLAGRVREVRVPDGEVRIGGFGGPAGLASWMRERGTDVLVDATHPFAQRMSESAAEAARLTGAALLALRRPGWHPGPGDDWYRVPSMREAAAALHRFGPRVLLTTGRQDASAFADLDDHRFLLRCVDPPQPPLPRHLRVLLDRGPYTVDGELELLRDHDIDVLVTKDSGGEMTAAKLRAARRLAIPVVVVSRPEPPAGPVVRTPRAAVAWLEDHSG